MSRIAVIADIHGNVPALEAVLEDLEREAPDEVLVGGDMVGRGPEGSRVLQSLAARGWRSVRGNHEDYLLEFRARRVPDAWWEAPEWAAARFMAAELSDEDVDRISALPEEIASRLEPELRLVHGSPASNKEGLGPWTSDGHLERHLATVDGSLLVCAHTHRPMHRRLPGGEVVNVGSVGLPFNRDRRAQYAIFRRTSEGWMVERRKVRYDVERTLEAYERTGFLIRGGVTAELLRLELLEAAPFLVPFLYWSKLRQAEPRVEEIPAFRQIYDPDAPREEMFRHLSSGLPKPASR